MNFMYDIIIVGAGPAGLTAGIYAGRAGLDALIIDNGASGGTANTAPLVENYPGFDKIPGTELMKNIADQTKEYCEIKEFTIVQDVKRADDIFSVETSDGVFDSKYIILATGSKHKTLDAPGVSKFSGRGVSYCAVCDGAFFLNREVLVVGGGNSAATEALYLNRVGVKCSLVHRRDKLRCDEKLQEDLKNNNIGIYWDSEVREVRGENSVEEVVLYNKKTGEESVVSVNGLFIAIGNIPNNELASKLGIECDQLGYIKTDENMQTNVKGVYAAGDVTGGIKQIVVSASQGATATTSIQKLLY